RRGSRRYSHSLAGVWIEMTSHWRVTAAASVTPLAGVWIEIDCSASSISMNIVTPLAGVWIEIGLT
ncbi:MAG: hypothetical protein ACI4R5_09300, partial [Acetatifactor sp.]